MWWPRSTYDSDSLANRSPAASTMIEYGKDRSPTMNPGPSPGSGATDAPHQASSISWRAAPASAAISMGPPRLPGAPDGEPSIPWYFWRHSLFWSNPPPASMTPCRARTPTRRPPRVVRTPTTRSSSNTSSSRGESSHSDACCCWTTTSKNAAANAAPIPATRWPRATAPIVRKTSRAPRARPPGVDHARPRSQTSSVLIGMATGAWQVSHAVPIRLTSKGFTSTARPTLPPGSSG